MVKPPNCLLFSRREKKKSLFGSSFRTLGLLFIALIGTFYTLSEVRKSHLRGSVRQAFRKEAFGSKSAEGGIQEYIRRGRHSGVYPEEEAFRGIVHRWRQLQGLSAKGTIERFQRSCLGGGVYRRHSEGSV